VRSLLAQAGGVLRWSSGDPDFATAVAGGHQLRFSYLSFAAWRDGKMVSLRDVPATPGRDPYVPVREFARLLGVSVSIAQA
jgi:hypothetical protein